jgi:predicted nuclease of restriction endonuclease-like (RecB) superfamily
MGDYWSIRQLNRQVGSQICERTALSKRTVKVKKADGGWRLR